MKEKLAKVGDFKIGGRTIIAVISGDDKTQVEVSDVLNKLLDIGRK